MSHGVIIYTVYLSLIPPSADRQQLQPLYIVLYLLIWGETSNIRFMAECICYIFHNMANEMHGTLFTKVQPVSGGTCQTATLGEEAFLRDVVTPIYEVLRKIRTLGMLRSRFESVPSAFNGRLIPMQKVEPKRDHQVMLNFFSIMLNELTQELIFFYEYLIN